MTATTREEALAVGAKFFFTGLPCKNGHIAARRVINKQCVECGRLQTARWTKANHAKAMEMTRRWRAANREAILRDMRANRARDPEPWRARYRAWSKKNPEKVKAKNRNTNAQRKGAVGSHTQADLERIFVAQNGRCAYCRISLRKVESNVDHIMPICRGGTNNRDNIQILCRACNQSKWGHDPISFAQSRGLLA